MEFLTLLIVLGLIQIWGSGAPLQRDQWFSELAKKTRSFVKITPLHLLIIVGLPTLAVVVLLALVESSLFGLVSLILYVCILLFGLGRGDVSESIRRYLSAWNHSNFESAYAQALAIGDFQESDAISDHESLHRHVRSAFLYEGFERWFAVVFWFLLLGPAGAVAYRLSYLSGRLECLSDEERQVALRFVHYLDWVPVRLLILSFALTGNFVTGFNQLWLKLTDNQPIPELLDDCALAAINAVDTLPGDMQAFIEYGRQEILSLQSLLSRSVICWVVFIALGTVVAG